MIVVHIAPKTVYTENWGYQENLLTKYQAKIGHEVTLIVPTNKFNTSGEVVNCGCEDYLNEDNVRVIRIERKKYCVTQITELCSYLPVSKYLLEIKPDCIFVHGLVSTSILDAAKYKREVNRNCRIIQDNHLDGNNCSSVFGLKYRMFKAFYRLLERRVDKWVDRVYGVTPWRADFAVTEYGANKHKTELLIMGADDEKMRLQYREEIRSNLREKYGVEEDEFLIVTGGKIDKAKNVHTLIDACEQLHSVKLLIFGNLLPDIKDYIKRKVATNRNIIYIGWIDSSDVYNYFYSADLIVFPGGHSVMWEQACASKTPCLFKRWPGMEHVNNGGNAAFLDAVTTTTIKDKIEELKNTGEYQHMDAVAKSNATVIFLYSHIAERSLE